jgi:hypothetical protein
MVLTCRERDIVVLVKARKDLLEHQLELLLVLLKHLVPPLDPHYTRLTWVLQDLVDRAYLSCSL